MRFMKKHSTWKRALVRCALAVLFSVPVGAMAQAISPPPLPPKISGMSCSNGVVRLDIINPLAGVPSTIQSSLSVTNRLSQWNDVYSYVSTTPTTNWSGPVIPGAKSEFYVVKTTCGAPYFFDDFENGLTNWTVSGDDWALTDSTYHSSTHMVAYTNYVANVDATNTLVHAIDLSGSTSPVLSFWHRYSVTIADYAYVEISTNGGVSWPITLATYHYATVATWQQELFDLSAYKQQQIKIRFRLRSGGGSGGSWYVDDVTIGEN
jgi:hypothetical protein